MEDNTKIKYDEIKAKNEEMEFKMQELKQKLDEAIADKRNAEVLVDTRINSKLRLLHSAKPFLGDIDSYVNHNERSIMEAVINCIRGDSSDFSDDSDDMVKGRYLECIKNAEARERERELNAKYNTDEEADNNNNNGHLNRPLTMDEGLKMQVKKDWENARYEHMKEIQNRNN